MDAGAYMTGSGFDFLERRDLMTALRRCASETPRAIPTQITAGSSDSGLE